MKQKLGNFELLEQIDPGGYTIVWRAVEHMGHGVTRPAAVKILQGWKADDPAQIAALRREVGVLADLSTCPNIVTIYGFDIDPEVGPWIAMELGGKSLRHFIPEEAPGDPDTVRQLLRDVLRALVAMHGASPAVLHRDLKPNNILSTGFGTWKLADFGLAKRSETESTLNVLTVQYAAPELLDASLGKEGPWTDLYSLGLIAYELALGRKGYRAQFPSIYDPFASSDATRVDERPKWMYWHTSQQMTIKPLAELLPGFPQDISDLVADMTKKAVKDRLQSASEAMSRLREASAIPSTGPAFTLAREESRRRQQSSVALVGVAAGALLIVLLMGGWLAFEILSRPVLALDKGGVFRTDTGTVAVSGTIRNMPAKGVATLHTSEGPGIPVTVDSGGKFAVEVKVDKLGDMPARLRLTRGKVRLIDQPIRVERVAPKTVRVVVATEPPMANAEVQLFPGGPEAKPVVVRTGEDGTGEALLAYGRFEMRVVHPRCQPWRKELETGADPVRSFKVGLERLSEAAVAQKRLNLLSRVMAGIEASQAGQAEAISSVESARAELMLLDAGLTDEGARRRLSIVEEVLDVSRRALSGDGRASERLATLRGELDELARAIGGTLGSERRQALMRDLAVAVDRSLKGDAAAPDGISRIRGELRALDAQEGVGVGDAAQRDRLLGELHTLSTRASRGDVQASAQLRESFRQLQALPVPAGTGLTGRRQTLMDDLARAVARAVSGDAAAVSSIRQARERIVNLDREERVPAPVALRRTKLLGDIVELASSAAGGDVQAARRLKEVERDLLALDTGGSGESALIAARDPASLQRRVALVREIGELSGSVARDTKAAARLKQIRTELQAMDVAEGSIAGAITRRRMDLLNELGEVIELAAGRDAAAQDRLALIQRELAILVAVEHAAGDAGAFAEAAAAMIGSNPSLNLIDRATLLQLSDDEFLAFVEAVVPRGALAVEVVPNLRRLRVRGTVLTERELGLLTSRLDPASPRLMLEVRVDPWAVCRRLEERLADEGFAGVRVHPYLAPYETTLFVQFMAAEAPDAEARAKAVASQFVIDQDILYVQPYRAERPAQATPEDEPRAATR